MNFRRAGLACALLTAILFAINLADANTYNFRVFDNTTWENDSRLNFTVTISQEGQNKVGFLFKNNSSIYTSITSVYFDNGPLLTLDTNFLESTGVDYIQGKKNANLPGGNTLTPKFAKPADFSVNPDNKGSENGFSGNGINPKLTEQDSEEWLKIFFTVQLESPQTSYYQQVVSDIADGDLRIGLHIQSIGGDSGPSVSAINQITIIPEPATIAILTLGGLLIFRKR